MAGRRRDVRLAGRLLDRPPGTKLDLNGVVKALAVDRALTLLARDGWVSAGGDVAVRGGAAVGMPDGAVVHVHAGGAATSGTTRRRWLRGGREQHHLLDPRTGCPARARWREVTVVAGTCVAADVAAKAAFLLSDDGPDWLDERGLAGRFLGDGEVVENLAWHRALAEAVAC